MNFLSQQGAKDFPGLLYLGFNQDASWFTTGTNTGFRIFHAGMDNCPQKIERGTACSFLFHFYFLTSDGVFASGQISLMVCVLLKCCFVVICWRL